MLAAWQLGPLLVSQTQKVRGAWGPRSACPAEAQPASTWPLRTLTSAMRNPVSPGRELGESRSFRNSDKKITKMEGSPFIPHDSIESLTAEPCAMSQVTQRWAQQMWSLFSGCL